jgi:hypothetical protein
MPGYHPLFADLTQTMQIFSIKITELVGFNWPLEVYGVVAARDAVDYRRNHLFLRSRDNCQFLKDKEVHMGIFMFFLFLSLLDSLLTSKLRMMMLAGFLFALDWPVSCDYV